MDQRQTHGKRRSHPEPTPQRTHDLISKHLMRGRHSWHSAPKGTCGARFCDGVELDTSSRVSQLQRLQRCMGRATGASVQWCARYGQGRPCGSESSKRAPTLPRCRGKPARVAVLVVRVPLHGLNAVRSQCGRVRSCRAGIEQRVVSVTCPSRTAAIFHDGSE
jgi:hypothetical protein